MSAPLFTYGGRPMTKALQVALDRVTDRDLVARALESHGSGPLAGVYRALAMELRLLDLAEQAALSALSADALADLPTPPSEALGVGDGRALWVDEDGWPTDGPGAA